MDYEKQRKFVIKKMLFNLSDNSYKADAPLMTYVYKKYKTSGSRDEFLEKLERFGFVQMYAGFFRVSLNPARFQVSLNSALSRIARTTDFRG